jgi:hypothetical protein
MRPWKAGMRIFRLAFCGLAAALFLFSMLMQGSSRARASEITCALSWDELREDEKPKDRAPNSFDDVVGESTYASLWPSGRRPKPTTCVRILIKGKIETGDAATFLKILGSNHPFVKAIILWSPGGSVVEAVKIGRIIRKYMLTTKAPFEIGDPVNVGNGALFDPRDDRLFDPRDDHLYQLRARHLCEGTSCNCASACFLIWASGIERHGNALGLHRPTTRSTYFTDLPPDQASATYRRVLSDIETYLSEMEIPRRYIEKLTDTSSDNISWLDWMEVLLAMSEPPSISEWLLASCGGLSQEELKLVTEKDSYNKLSPDVRDRLILKTRQVAKCKTTKIENYKDSATSVRSIDALERRPEKAGASRLVRGPLPGSRTVSQPINPTQPQNNLPGCSDLRGIATLIMRANPGPLEPRALASAVEQYQIAMGCRPAPVETQCSWLGSTWTCKTR